MKYHTLSSVVCLLISLVVVQARGLYWENVEIVKAIDVSKSYVNEAAEITIKNTGEKPDDLYLVAFTSEVADSLSMFSSMLKGKNVFIECALTNKFKHLPNGQKVQYGSVRLPTPVQPGEQIEIVIRYSHKANFSPVPKHIEMSDTQTLVLETETLPFSPYLTDKFTVSIIGSDSIEKYKDAASKDQQNSNAFTITEENVTEPFTLSRSQFLYTHNAPLTRAVHLNREAWISHWGSTVEFKEDYELVNDAAELSSGFSRAEFMKSGLAKKPSHALVALDIPLPENSHSHYYTDLVGMISTARVFSNHYILKPRYPIFGGWKFNFTIGWTNSLTDYLKVLSNDEYIISIPVLEGPQDIFYDAVTLSVYLPEGAVVKDIQTPMVNSDTQTTYEHSYFDLGSGHTKVAITLKNLNDQMRDGPVFLKYHYSQADLLRKPASIAIYVFIALFSLFLIKKIQLVIYA